MPRSKKIEMYPSVWWDLMEVLRGGQGEVEIPFVSEKHAENKRQEYYAFSNALYHAATARPDFTREQKTTYHEYYMLSAQYNVKRNGNIITFTLKGKSDANQAFASGLAKYLQPAESVPAGETAMDNVMSKLYGGKENVNNT